MALPSRGSTQRWATSHCTASWKILRLFEFQASKLLGFHSPKAPCHMTLKPRLWAAHVLLPAPVERQERCCRHVNFKGFPNSCSKSPSQFENSNISSSLSQPEFCFRRFAASLAAAIGGLWLWHAILARQLDSSLITSCPTCFFYANRGNNLQSFRGRTWQQLCMAFLTSSCPCSPCPFGTCAFNCNLGLLKLLQVYLFHCEKGQLKPLALTLSGTEDN